MEKIVGLIDFHSSATTNACVRSLRSTSNSSELSVVVVDNGGDYEAPDESVYVIRPGQNAGFAGGCNLLVEHARKKGAVWLWLLNNDCLVRPDSVSVFEGLCDSVLADVYTSVTLKDDTDIVWYAGGLTDGLTWRQKHLAYGEKFRPPAEPYWFTQWASGANLFLPARTVQRCEPFDEDLFLYLEEVEWQVRNGFSVVVSAAPIVRHFAGTTTRSTGSSLESFFSARNSWIIGTKTSATRRTIFTLYWILDYLIKPLARGDRTRASAAAMGWRARAMTGPAALDFYIHRRNGVETP